MDNLYKYLGIEHSYDNINCITLIKLFYEQELGLTFELPEFTKSRAWMRQYSSEYLDEFILKHAVKIELTDIKNYDLIAFKSRKSNLIYHFGMFISPNRILHVQDSDVSRLDYITEEHITDIYSVYRHVNLV